MTTAIDTNVLLDIVTNDERYFEHACSAVTHAVQAGAALVSSIVYAELGVHFDQALSDLDAFLQDLGISLDPLLSDSTLKVAARAWRTYLVQRGQQSQCPQCGHVFDIVCPRCTHHVPWRQHMLADFLIGAHALVQADALLTRDRHIYGTYFSGLRLVQFDG